jgi:hypothetical protein
MEKRLREIAETTIKNISNIFYNLDEWGNKKYDIDKLEGVFAFEYIIEGQQRLFMNSWLKLILKVSLINALLLKHQLENSLPNQLIKKYQETRPANRAGFKM